MNDMEYIFHKVNKKEITEKEVIDNIYEKIKNVTNNLS